MMRYPLKQHLSLLSTLAALLIALGISLVPSQITYAAVTVVETGGSTDVNEATPAATDTYQLTFAPAPTDTITITTTITDTIAQCSVTQAPANPVPAGTTSVTFTVTVIDDDVAEDNSNAFKCHIQHELTSADATYNGPMVSVTVNVTDDETAGVTITPATTLPVTEGSSVTYTIALDSRPASDITIQITAGSGDCTFSGNPSTTVTILAYANPPQVDITVDAEADGVDETSPEDCILAHSVTTTAPKYTTLTIPNVTLSITDSDTAGVSGIPATLNLDEGGSSTFNVTLDTIPETAVTFDIAPDDPTQCSVTSPIMIGALQDPPEAAITVNVLADALVEGPHTCTLTYTISGDPFYEALPDPTTLININDITPGLFFQHTGGQTVVAEPSGTDTYQIRLNAPPSSGTVTIEITTDTECSVTATPPLTLTFDTANWNVFQTVTVTAVDDLTPEAPQHPCVVTHTTAGSSDPNYNLPADTSFPVLVQDNDAAGVVVDTGALTTVREDGTNNSTYTLRLLTTPTADVIINITPDTQCAVTPTSLTLNAATMTGTVTVNGAPDTTEEAATHPCVITHTIDPTSDALYLGVIVPDATANVADDDGSFTVSAAPGTILENSVTGATLTFSIAFAATTDITIALTPDAQCETLPVAQVVIPAGSLSVTATGRAINDLVAEGGHSCTIVTGAASGGGDKYNGKAVDDITLNITDDDTADVTITESGGTTAITEGGATDTYTVVLTSQPVNPVTITISPNSQCTTSPATLTFNPTGANLWNVSQAVTVTAVDDAVVEGPHTCAITHTAAGDSTYTALTINSVSAAVTDNDTADVTITESGGTTAITEGGATDTYTVVLTTQPVNPVTITITPDIQCTTSAATLLFNPSGASLWNVPQTVTVTADDDAAVEGNHTCTITHSASGDPAYTTPPLTIDSVIAAVTDNDGAVVTVNPNPVNLTEGGAGAAVSFSLSIAPTVDVTINLAPDTQCTVTPVTSLTFTTLNWNTAQNVTVAAGEDGDVEGNHTCTVVTTMSTADPAYSLVNPADIIGNITDNDLAQITVSPTAATITEGQTQVITFTVPSAPTANLDIPITITAQCTVSTNTVTIPTGGTSATVTVTAIDDSTIEASQSCTVGTNTSTSGDPIYNGINPADATITINDNDSAGVTITESGGSTTITEGGATDTYTVVLNTQPTNPVTITIGPNAAQCTTGVTTLTFNPAGANLWNVTQTVTVTAVDDTAVEGPHTCAITHSASGDPAYTTPPLTIASVTANITDNDTGTPGISVNPTVATVTEGGSVTITFRLNTQPTADVTFTFTTDVNHQCTIAPLFVTLTSTNWNTGVTATITAIEDNVIEGTHSCVITTNPATSADPNYTNRDPANITVTITDNDGTVATSTPIPTVTPFVTATFPPTYTPAPSPTPPPAGNVQEVKGLAVRTGPYLGATLIAVAKPGTTYSVIAHSNDEGGEYTWFLITVGNKTGWVSGRYFKYNGDPNGLPVMGSIFDQIDNPPSVGARANMGAFTDLRRRPSPRSQILRQFSPDTVVEVTGRTVQEGGNYWFQVRIDGQTGWVNGAFVRLIEGNIENVPIR